jgi:transcriptional regulator NrdR family protein
MKCRVCEHDEHRVIRTLVRDGDIVRHRRCDRCGNTSKTYECADADIEHDRKVIAKACELAALLEKGTM